MDSTSTGGFFRSSELWSVAWILRCGLGSVGVCLIADDYIVLLSLGSMKFKVYHCHSRKQLRID